MMYTEDQLLSISALQHLMFCPRQCGLIHIEQCWTENIFTAKGQIMHETAHSGKNESRGDLCIVRSLRLRSYGLGLTGVADIVEFNRTDNQNGVALPDRSGRWKPKIVEYKLGKPKSNRCDEIQLCAQGLCLEEMLNCQIKEGQLYYGRTKRRCDVVFDDELRELTRKFAQELHNLIDIGVTPKAQFTRKCKNCSLFEICMPNSAGKGKSVTGYLKRSIKKSLEDKGEFD